MVENRVLLHTTHLQRLFRRRSLVCFFWKFVDRKLPTVQWRRTQKGLKRIAKQQYQHGYQYAMANGDQRRVTGVQERAGRSWPCQITTIKGSRLLFAFRGADEGGANQPQAEVPARYSKRKYGPSISQEARSRSSLHYVVACRAQHALNSHRPHRWFAKHAHRGPSKW